MEAPAMISDALDRVYNSLHGTLKDLTPDELLAGLRPHIAWLVWHLTRVQDHNISALAGREQAWIAEGWHKRFGMAPEPRDYAPGHVHTPEQVEAFAVKDARLLLDYFDAVLVRTKDYLSTLSPEDLDRVLDEPRYQPLPTVGVRLVSVITDNLRHAGQVDYLHGLIRRQGWFPSLLK